MGLTSRRSFLGALGALPLAARAGRGLGWLRAPAQQARLIQSPAEALNVFDFEAVARARLPIAHWGYLATGVDDDTTLRTNREGFARFQLRARRLVDTRRIDLGCELLGQRLDNPIILAPAGSQRAFHPDGELAAARAARTGNHLQILSTVTTTSVEEVAEARGAPVWYQLYPTDTWRIAEALIRRAEAAGCPVLVLTVDLNAGSNRETMLRAMRADPRDCTPCHDGTFRGFSGRKPMFEGLNTRDANFGTPGMTWEFLDRLRQATRMKLVVKGIVSAEDAERCTGAGVDAIIVSNHGGRAEESGRSTIEALPEIVAAVRGRLPVVIDSGFRRGTDIYKALALGAQAVCVGRPYLWGLAAFGQPGVERVLELLRTELRTALGHAGATSLQGLDSRSVIARPG